MPAGQRGPLSTRGTSEAGGGVLLKSFTPVSDFTEETPQSAYGCQLPFQGSLLRKLFVCSSAAMSKPSGGIARCPRCPPEACQRRLLPFPVSVMLIFKRFPVKTGNFISYGVCKFAFLGSPLGELSPQVTEGFPATAANRFHKELRFFFSLLKRKKEAKKEKSSPTLVLYGNVSHEDYTRDFHQQKFPGGANRRLLPP